MRNKTWKREIAFVILIYLGWLGATDRVEALKVVVWPAMFYVGASYGMSWATKQTDFTQRKG